MSEESLTLYYNIEQQESDSTSIEIDSNQDRS